MDLQPNPPPPRPRGRDRRRTTWRTLVGAFRDRRKGGRRGADPPAYPDYFSPILFAAIVLLLCLSLVDAFATLYWVDQGWATEANPVMAAVLPWGDRAFVGYKLVLTTAGVAFLLYCSPFYRINLILAFLDLLYLGLAGYHFHIYLTHTL